MNEVLRYGLLGPPVLWQDGAQVAINARRERVALGVLLLHANQVVTAEDLIDALWPEEPPPSARAQVHGCVFRLRRLLGDQALHTSAPGYRLHVRDEEFDVRVFEQAVALGREELANGRPAAAGTLLRRALGLWRGPALATLDSPAARAEAARLDELRLTVWEEYADTGLRFGTIDDLVGELTALVTRHPLRETFIRQLMVALYRSGRQGEALEVYRRARKDLAEQLGVPPGPVLEATHRRILCGDPSLHDSAAVAREEGPAVVRSALLPLAVRGFVGRRDQLAQLDELADESRRDNSVTIAAIMGTAGIGKTALAVRWAHQARERFPDGQLFVNLRGFDPSGRALQPEEAIREFLHALGVPPERVPVEPASQAALYRTLLTGRRILIFLDNARDAEQVRPLLPDEPGCLVLVTSRSGLTGLLTVEGAQPLTLDLLSVAEARELLSHRIGRDRVTADSGAADAISASCARLPLALVTAAARAATHPDFPLAALAEELRDAGPGLDALDGDETSGVRAAFSWSYRLLSEPAARLFRLLGLYPGPQITPIAAASLAGLAVGPARRMLAELARAHMLTEQAPGRFGCHDLLRAYAIERTHALDSAEQRREALLRLLDHYLHTADGADLLMDPYRVPIALPPPRPGVTVEHLLDSAAGFAWFAAEWPTLEALTRHAATAGFGAYVWQLAWAYSDFLYWRGRWHDLTTTHRIALEVARRLGSPAGQAHAHRGLAGACALLARHGEAHDHLLRALDLFGAVDDQADQAHIHRNLAQVLEGLGRHAPARAHARQAYQIYRVIGDRTGQAKALSAIGWYHALLGDHDRALRCGRRALDLHRAQGDVRAEAVTWHRLGYSHHQLGDHGQAIACYEHAVAMLRRFGDRAYETVVLDHLGDTYLSVADVGAARTSWTGALAILEQIGDPHAQEVRAKLHRTG
ncbi:BTAD domain-containing putative transcriptional regulator [Acrocarpospora sp. B8E8]|uniref:AfsR/SARP family transcriptional regulator n=1 Tax=Acrocarpospora sp. B8E8 TaxID=3153572 RepID=UPI00325DB05E